MCWWVSKQNQFIVKHTLFVAVYSNRYKEHDKRGGRNYWHKEINVSVENRRSMAAFYQLR